MPGRTNAKDRFLIITMLALAFGFVIAGIHEHAVLNKRANASFAAQELHVQLSDVIGNHPTFRGHVECPYTLVEFGDYQCPPCRYVSQLIPSTLSNYPGKVKFEFRNLPLTSIHKYAMRAAVVAEEARIQGAFWPVHDRLYFGSVVHFNLSNINQVVSVSGLDKKHILQGSDMLARKAVNEDIAAAAHIGIYSTPTFILCCPSGKIMKLESLAELDSIIK